MTPLEILCEASRRHIRLTPDGPRLIATCPGPLPADIARVLIANKPALLKLLTARRHLASQILQGEFDGGGMNGKMWNDLYVRLAENILDPQCREAFDRVRAIGKAHSPNRK